MQDEEPAQLEMVQGLGVVQACMGCSVAPLSTMEAEYVALSDLGPNATWLRNLYGQLGFRQNYPTVIKGDNDDSVVLTQQTKHIALHHHWVRDLVTNKILDIQNCRNPEQTVDILKNALPQPKFTQHKAEMEIQLIE